MLKKLATLSFVTFSLALGLSATGVAAAKDVRIATNVPYKPMEYTKPDGSLTGFDIDLGNALCKQAGLSCTWTQQSWNGIIPGLMARKYDAIMSSITINDERKRVLLFSDPYIIVPSGFFVPAKSNLTDPNEQTLKGKKIGVQRGTVQDQYLTDKYGNELTVKRYANADDVAVDMAAGRLDGAFFDFPTGQSTLLDQGGYKAVGPKLTKPESSFGTGFGIALRKNEQDLAEKFNAALAVLKKNGTYDKIYAQYFGKKPSAAK